MKKILLLPALVAVIALGSCSGTSSEKQGSGLRAKIENCTNTDSIAAYVNDAKAYVSKLIDEGKIDEAKKYLAEKGKDLKIEVEVRNTDEINEALAAGVDRIMLDNFTPERTREAVQLINGRVEVESSGGITLETLRAYGEAGVDFISVGALTHSVKGLDMSFKAC